MIIIVQYRVTGISLVQPIKRKKLNAFMLVCIYLGVFQLADDPGGDLLGLRGDVQHVEHQHPGHDTVTSMKKNMSVP